MKIKVICLSKSKDKHLERMEAEYVKRLKGQVRLDVIEMDVQKFLKSDVFQKSSSPYLVAMDERGDLLSTQEFAAKVEVLRDQLGSRELVFVVGDAFGLPEQVKSKAELLLSLSPLTLSFQIARLVLVEQIYRAFTIFSGHPYHKT